MWLSPQNKTRLAFCLIIFGALIAIFLAKQSNPQSLHFIVRKNTAYGYGTTTSHSLDVFKKFINNHPNIDKLVLVYMPGTTDSHTNLKIARLIRQKGLKTHLEHHSRIASGAVDLFLAGTERSMECGAIIGVHSWSIGDNISPKDIGRDYNRPIHEKFLSDMNITPQFYQFTRDAAEPEDMHYMTISEIQNFGLLTHNIECN